MGFKHRRGSWIPGKERAEKVLASAVSIDGRKEWTCRRCYRDIPAGLRGEYMQAIVARNGEWSTGSSTSSGEEERRNKSLEAEIRSFEPGLRPWKRGKVGRGFHQGERAAWNKSGVRRWTSRMRPRVARSKMSKRRSSRRSCDIEKLSCVPKEFQESQKSNVQQQLQEG